MNKKDAIKIVEILKTTYPDAKCSLDFNTPFEMLVAVCLSAQCTDDRVNKTTPSLFAEFDTPEEFANADIKELERYTDHLLHTLKTIAGEDSYREAAKKRPKKNDPISI